MKFLSVCLLSLALLPACQSTEPNYLTDRGGDLVDIVRGHVIAGKAVAAQVEVTRFLSLGFTWEDDAWAGGLHNRAVGDWYETVQAWGLLVGQHNEMFMEGVPYVSGSYGWDFENQGSLFEEAVQANRFDIATLRGTLALGLGIDLELRLGEAFDFLAGLFTWDPAGDDKASY